MGAPLNMTRDERLVRGRNAYLAGAVRTIARRVNDLTDEQVATLRAALSTKPKTA